MVQMLKENANTRLRTLRRNTFRYFWEEANQDHADATGYRGFYYHFLDVATVGLVFSHPLRCGPGPARETWSSRDPYP